MTENRNAYTVFMGQLDKDLGAGARIILKQILEKDDGYHNMWRISWLPEELTASEKGLYCTQLNLILGLWWKRGNCP
jgi:hypothetical protein